MQNTNTIIIQNIFLANNGYDPQLNARAGRCIVCVGEYFKQLCVAFHTQVQSGSLRVPALSLGGFR